MADGYTAIQGMIDRLRSLGQATEAIAEDIAPALRSELESNISAVRAPDGTPWKPTQKGHAPLQGAGKALGVAAVGKKVVARLVGVEARHHSGTARGGIARPILPDKDLPKQIVDLIIRVAEQRFRIIMGGS